MSEFPDTELSWRIRANRGRRLRPEFAARLEETLGYRPLDSDFLDLRESDRLTSELSRRLDELRPTRTWPESERETVLAEATHMSKRLGDDHRALLTCFKDWEYLGAVHVRSQVVLTSLRTYWREGLEPVCLLTHGLTDWLYLDYTEPKQMLGDDEYELYASGAFASIGEPSDRDVSGPGSNTS